MTSTTKTLLVNCSLKGTVKSDLIGALRKFSECSVVNFGDVTDSYQIAGNIDAIVISGSSARIVNPSHKAKFERVEKLIESCNIPVFGICFGHQLLCSAFGAKTGSLSKSVIDRFEYIRIIETNGIFIGFSERQAVPLSECHNDYVLKEGLDGAGFILLADSASCEVEAVKHKTKPFYGVQFHPERTTIKEERHCEGHKIIKNFFNNIRK